jgi:hypothetical protein
VFAVEIGVQFLAGAEMAPPEVPGLFFLQQGARPIAADQQAETVVRFLLVVPAFGLDRHGVILMLCACGGSIPRNWSKTALR